MNDRQTRWLKVPEPMNREALRNRPEVIQAAEVLKNGGLVAFPTETVYGLGAIATDSEAVQHIFAAKGRPSDNPLIIHFGQMEDIRDWVAEFPPLAEKLAETFWPGPLTLVLPHRGNLSPFVTAGLPTVAVRVPDHPVALSLLSQVRLPVAAPSANRSGRPSPTAAEHVWQDLEGRFDLLLDGGITGVGLESTVVDVTGEIPVVLRPGGIPLEALEKAVGRVEVDPGIQQAMKNPRSPGMKYRHYAPEANMWLIQGEYPALLNLMRSKVQEAKRTGVKVGVLVTEESRGKVEADVVVICGRRNDPESVARGLYRALREFDEQKVDLIFSETFPEEGVFHAVMNRLHKAAEGKVIDQDGELL